MIFPELFDGKIMGFFTDREVGLDVSSLTGRKVYFPKQEHTDTVIDVDDDLTVRTADAVVTSRHDIMLGVKTADCVPILMYDPIKGVIAAVHAGWRGTSKGIIKKTIKYMAKKYKCKPDDLLVALGPAIRWSCYTVGEDVLSAVKKATGEGDYFIDKDGVIAVDLQSANMFQAISEGVLQYHISISEECTYCYPERYFSYRYDKKNPGRQGGFIGMP